MDAVEYFLFEQKRGYCEQFASSLVVMARTLGIPARLTTGYVPASTTRSPASTRCAPPTPTPGSRSTSPAMVGPPSTRRLASTRRPGSTGRWAIYRKRRLRLPGEECRRSPGPCSNTGTRRCRDPDTGRRELRPLEHPYRRAARQRALPFVRLLPETSLAPPQASAKRIGQGLGRQALQPLPQDHSLAGGGRIAAKPQETPEVRGARPSSSGSPGWPGWGRSTSTPASATLYQQPSSRSSTAWTRRPRRDAAAQGRSRSGGNAIPRRPRR